MRETVVTSGGVIPGWRVIRSDAGRFWASRVEPFPRETEWHAPPFRTVDGDTLDELRAEVERQEEAARAVEAVASTAAGEVTA
ncbi:hypothetical protein GCM10017673_22520 [Streptosporangium violaceochromogenes]|nr:hypothetical protein GCM10017673_22520 [Streptosporangium violaceochromogenes]